MTKVEVKVLKELLKESKRRTKLSVIRSYLGGSALIISIISLIIVITQVI